MPYQQVPEFLQRLRTRSRSIAACALEFAVLTACRTSEVLGAVRQEFDFDSQVWTVPAHRMKARKEHRVPLSDRAMTLVVRLKDNGEPFVFIGYNNTKLDDDTMRSLMRKLEVPFTVHGFRASLRTWASDNTDDFYVAELCLAHAVGNAAARAYLRGDALEKRRKIMAEWAEYCG